MPVQMRSSTCSEGALMLFHRNAFDLDSDADVLADSEALDADSGG